MPTKNRGFTVIELLIVLALLGVLAAIAYPRYVAYSTRSKVAQVLKLANKDTQQLSDYYGKTGSMPKDKTAAEKAGIKLAIASDSKYLARDATYQETPGGNGKKDLVKLTYTFAHIAPSVNHKSVLLTSDIESSQIEWRCTSSQIKAADLPARCQSTAK